MFAAHLYKKLKNVIIKSDNKHISKLYLRAKEIKQDVKKKRNDRNIRKGRLNFVTMDELTLWTIDWIKSFPSSYDIIVGIPRSGLLVANIIALKLAKPLTTPELFCKNQYWKTKRIKVQVEYKKILLVDDSCRSGNSLKEGLQTLYSCSKDLDITTAALIVKKESKELVDMYYKVVPKPRIFEWNILHQKTVNILASTLEGVICEKCPECVDLEDVKYSQWIKSAKPYLIPLYEIDIIISSRSEKYRIDTEIWLDKHKVRYKKLLLRDNPPEQEMKEESTQNIIEMLLKLKPDMFFVGSYNQSELIWKNSRIPTFCFDEISLFS